MVVPLPGAGGAGLLWPCYLGPHPHQLRLPVTLAPDWSASANAGLWLAEPLLGINKCQALTRALRWVTQSGAKLWKWWENKFFKTMNQESKLSLSSSGRTSFWQREEQSVPSAASDLYIKSKLYQGCIDNVVCIKWWWLKCLLYIQRWNHQMQKRLNW